MLFLFSRFFDRFFITLSFLLLIFFLPTTIEAFPKNTIEIRCGAFFHSNHTIRHLYGNTGTSYSLEASRMLKFSVSGWMNLDYFSKHGKIPGCSGHTHIKIPNLSFGLKYVYPLREKMALYFGLGPSLSGIFIRNRSTCINDKASRMALGGILKSGICYHFYDNFFADFYIDYLYQPVRFKKRLDIGGLKTGIGLGYGF